MNFQLLIGGITDQSLRALISKFRKKSLENNISALEDVISFLQQNKDISKSANVFIDLYELLFESEFAQVRSKSVEMMSIICKNLSKNLKNFATRIFFANTFYMHDENNNVTTQACKLFDQHFSNSRTRNEIISAIASEVLDKVQLYFGRLQIKGEINAENWPRIFGTNLKICVFLNQNLKENTEIRKVFEAMNLSEYIKVGHGTFAKNISPFFRLAIYDFYQEALACGYDIPEINIIQLISTETNLNCQISLFSLLSEFIKKGSVDISQLKTALLEHLMNFEFPDQIGVVEFVLSLNDNEFLTKFMNSALQLKIIGISQIYFDIFTSSDNEVIESNLVTAFITAISTTSSNFLSTCSLSSFSVIANNERIFEPIYESNDQRIPGFLKFIGKEHAVEWLKRRKNITSRSLLTFIKQFGEETVRSIYPSINNIPLITESEILKELRRSQNENDENEMDSFVLKRNKKKKNKKNRQAKIESEIRPRARKQKKEKWGDKWKKRKQAVDDEDDDANDAYDEEFFEEEDNQIVHRTVSETNTESSQSQVSKFDFNDENFLKFFVLYANEEDVKNFSTNVENIVKIMQIWNRDLSVFKIKQIKDQVIDILEEDFSLSQKILEIFGNDEEVEDSVQAMASEFLVSGRKVDKSVFNHIQCSDEMIESFVMSDQIVSITPDHPLLEGCIKFIVDHIPTLDPIDLAGRAYDIVDRAEVNVKEFGYKVTKYPEFYCEFWSYVGFDQFDIHDVCLLLNSIIIKKMPWIDVFIYMRSVNWMSVPSHLWHFVENNPLMYDVAHEMELEYALACISAATKIKCDSSSDSLSVKVSMSEPPRKIASNDPDVIDALIEWHKIRIPTPDLRIEQPDYHDLKRTIVYLKQKIPILSTFEPIFPFLSRALKKISNMHYFLVMKILNIIKDAAKKITNVSLIAKQMIEQTVRFSPFPTIVSDEVEGAFKILKLLSKQEFNEIIISCADSFTHKNASHIMTFVAPLIVYFQSFELIESKLNSKLDTTQINAWPFITSCMALMPGDRRSQISESIAYDIIKILPRIQMNSPEFETIISTFPNTANAWMNGQDMERRKEVYGFTARVITPRLFKKMQKRLLSQRIEKIAYRFNPQTNTIKAMYQDNEDKIPVYLEITLPESYPFGNISIKCEFGNEEISRLCMHEVMNTLRKTESVNEAIVSWYTFVVKQVLESSPCIICFSYFSEGVAPSMRCSVCRNEFHKHCLKQWFAKSIDKTCPVCGARWK